MLNRAPAQQPRAYNETGIEDNPLAKSMSQEDFAQYLIHKMCAMLEEDDPKPDPEPEITDIQDLDYWI